MMVMEGKRGVDSLECNELAITLTIVCVCSNNLIATRTMHTRSAWRSNCLYVRQKAQ